MARGVEVIAVEPVEAMRETLAADVPDATVREGTAEAIPAAADSAETVVAAQAFHWFDAWPALDDIARVLCPGGQLMTVWNVRDESVAWVARYTSIVDRYEGDAPRYKTMQWRTAIEADERFSLHHELARPNPQRVDRERVVKRALSTSFIAALPDRDRKAVANEIRDVVRELDEIFDFPYVSHLQAWRLLS